MAQPKNLEMTNTPGVALQQIALIVKAVPAVLTSSGAADNLVLIKSAELDQQLRQFLNAGVRYVEAAVFVEGLLLTFKASIVKRGGQLPLHLHPVGEAGKFLAELYQRRRAASGRKHNPVPLLILNVVPLLEKTSGGGEV